jgi:glutamine synthetase
MQGDNNLMTKNGVLSDEARKAIAGILELAPAITAFGNKVPTSYLRLVPHQEAPTNVCWGDRNRSVLVRVPLGWTGGINMCAEANPLDANDENEVPQKQTAELRSSDCSADIYQLLAGMIVAARHGFEMENALERAEATYVNVNIHSEEYRSKVEALKSLPDSCIASADALESMRSYFERYDVFSSQMIDGIISELRKYNDGNLRAKISGSPAATQELVHKYWHCG